MIFIDMQNGSDWTTLKLNLAKSIFQTSINFKLFLDVIWHYFYDGNIAAILFMHHRFRHQYFKLVSILSRFWTLYGIFSIIAKLQQFYLCIIVLNMQKRSDWTT